MGVSEPQRLALHKAARAALGAEEGDILMALTPPANTDIATRQDVQRLEDRMNARFDQQDARIDAVEDRMNARIDRTAAELRAHTWKVVVATGAVLYLATVGTLLAGVGLMLRLLDLV